MASSLYLLPLNGGFLLVRNFCGPEGHQDAEDWCDISSGAACLGPISLLTQNCKVPLFLLLPPFLVPHLATPFTPTA